ncbi:hypothetical protein [Mesomycoplasma ovipneumoniae]|uniref:hypothetical protein n=1 Tax=Mesomycoplasma ovipneumoniae TaxID=29562 RepID=UPI00311CCBE8
MENIINFNNEKKQKLVFHNIKNKYWNYFSLELDAKQCGFIYSSDPNFFNEFKTILQKENSYNGFILENDRPYDYSKNSCFSDFLSKEMYERIKKKLVIQVLLSHWNTKPFEIETNTTRKYMLYLTMPEIDRFLTNMDNQITNLLEKSAFFSFNFTEMVNKIKSDYKKLNENFYNLYIKTELNPKVEQENLNQELKLSNPFFDSKFDNFKSNETTQNALKIIKNDIKNIISQHNSLTNSADADLYKIKIFTTGYTCFLNLIKQSGNFRWLSTEQIFQIYYEFEVWMSKLLNQKSLDNIPSVQNFFDKTFADDFWLFWKKNRQQKMLEEKNKKAQKHFRTKKINSFRKENPYYQNLKVNSKTLLRANVLWQHEVIRMKKSLKKKNFRNSFFAKRLWVASIENKLRRLKNKISKSEYWTHFAFLRDTLVDLKNFFYYYNLSRIDTFLRKNQFLIFCFENKINFDILYQFYGDLPENILFFLELKKTKMGNYSRFLFDENSFYLGTTYKQRLFQHFFNDGDNTVQLFICAKRSIKPIRDFSIVFIENGTLIEYIQEVDLPLTPKTTFAKFFYQNSSFDRTNLYLLETQLYKQIQNEVFRKNPSGINNNFEYYADFWNPIKNIKVTNEFSSQNTLLDEDILVINL